MYTTYQCVEVVGDFLVGASAHQLDAFSLCDGSQTSSWACPDLPSKTNLGCHSKSTSYEEELQASKTHLVQVAGLDPNPPTKRRRLSDRSDREPSPVRRATKPEKQRESLPRPSSNSSVHPNIVALASSDDGKYVIIVTGEDKTIRVFQHEAGHLQQISQRSMPKRPSAVTLSTSDFVIICADKFGDVYSLPLLADSSQGQDITKLSSIACKPLSKEPKQFVSAANDLTVHSARNRRALQNQLKQNLVKADKVGINVDQQLLLGHVSMLTDVILVEECGRHYIITADRDEHIRVSRGVPQSHIIEAYCLGHSEFVSRLCVPNLAPHVLVSGGGDDDLFIWDWLSGNLLQRLNISTHIEEIMIGDPLSKRQGVGIGASDDSHSGKVVVSGIRHLLQGPELSSGSIVVMCEGVSALFFFALSPLGLLSHYQTLQLNGNPLAIATDRPRNNLIVSIDLVHSGSMAQPRGQEIPRVEPLQVVRFEDMEWNPSTFKFKAAGENYQAPLSGNDDEWSVVYSFGNLRKRAGG